MSMATQKFVARSCPPLQERRARQLLEFSGQGLEGVSREPLSLLPHRDLSVVRERACAPGATRLSRPDRPRPSRAARGPSMVAPPSAAPARLTRRGTVAASMAVLLLGASLLFAAHLSATNPGLGPELPSSAVTVRRGDTLWSIAREVAPRRDPRAVVEELRARNRLSDVTISPGQTLEVS